MKEEKKCPECKSPLSKTKMKALLVCKNKNCKKEYTEKEYELFSVEQKTKDLLNRSLNRLIEDEEFILESPSKYFDIGEKVNSTYGQSMTVIEKHQDKFYLIESGSSQRWVRWHDLYSSSIQKCPVLFNKRSENIYKRVQFSNRRLDGVLHYYYNCKLNMNPEYQRGFVWQEEHKTKLIESIFNGHDIGKMIFIRLPYQVNSYLYEILDGKQRLSTIIDFIEDRFKYKGYYYSQLQDRDKSEFLDYMIGVGETDEGFTDNDKIQYFLSVNDTGVPQDPKLLEALKKKLV